MASDPRGIPYSSRARFKSACATVNEASAFSTELRSAARLSSRVFTRCSIRHSVAARTGSS